jgi:hypothetical protein
MNFSFLLLCGAPPLARISKDVDVIPHTKYLRTRDLSIKQYLHLAKDRLLIE